MRIVVPYTKEVLDSIIYEYQELFWPFQFVFVLSSLYIVYSIWKGKEKNSSYIVGVLALFWFCLAVYETYYYNSINWIGSYIGYFFIFQALLLIWLGMIKQKIVFEKNKFLLVLALLLIVVYPLAQLTIGIDLFEISIVGMIPNITVLFSLILFLMNSKRVWSLFIIPLIWLSFSLYWNYLLLFS